jgi:hypothetical protein
MDGQWFRALVGSCFLLATVGTTSAFAGGPLIIFDPATRTPYAYPAGVVGVFTDLGRMGPLTNAQSDTLTAAGLAEWTGVATSFFAAAIAGRVDLGTGPVDITHVTASSVVGAFNGGGIHIIYDDSGLITSSFFGAPPGVLGIAGPDFSRTGTPELLESWVVVNGAAVDPFDVGGASFAGVYTHEFGHAINLAHTQTNGAIWFFGDDSGPSGCVTPYGGSPTAADVETMYPFLNPSAGGVGVEQATVNVLDDRAAISNLYPTGGWPSSAGTITGRIFLSDGATEVTGVNVIARNVAAPYEDAISALSGDLTQHRVGPDGLYTLNGLAPGADYVVYIDGIVRGGFSTAPADVPTEEFWNGVAESADPGVDAVCDVVPVTAVAGASAVADVVMNRLPPDLNEPNDAFAQATSISCPFASAGTTVNPPGDVDFYEFSAAAGDIVTVDIDADETGSTLDPLLAVFDGTGAFLMISDDDPAPGEPATLDPFVGLVIPTTGRFFVGVSAFRDFGFDGGGDGLTTGVYDLSVTCMRSPGPAGRGVLLGSTGAEGAALIGIDPASGAGTFRTPHGAFGPVTEIEFRADGVLFGATREDAGSIITIDIATGLEARMGRLDVGAVTGLEFVDGALYGTYIASSGEPSELVVVDQDTGELTFVGPTGFSDVGGLAFRPTTGTLYGVTSGTGGSDLITVDLATGAGTLVGPTGFVDVAALEFAPDGTLFGGIGGSSARAGELITIDPATGVAASVGGTGFPVLTGLTLVPLPLDHFMFYEVKRAKRSRKFRQFGPVTLADRFGQADYDVMKPQQVGLPADTGGEGIFDGVTHLVEYQISPVKGTPAFETVRDLRIVNQCTDLRLEVQKPVSLLVPSKKDLQNPVDPPDADDSAVDHFLCYQASRQEKRADGRRLPKFPKRLQEDVEDQFQARRYDLKKITKLCTPVHKSGDPTIATGRDKGSPFPITPAAIGNPDVYLVCYVARRAKKLIEQSGCGPVDPRDRGTRIDPQQGRHTKRRGVHVNNQLGPAQLDTIGESEFCVPSVRLVPEGDGGSSTASSRLIRSS